MQFETIHSLLKWFANREYKKPPKMPGNQDMMTIGGSSCFDDVKDIWDTYRKIEDVLNENLNGQDFYIINQSYRRKLRRAIGRRVGCSPRSVTRRKYIALRKLEPIMINQNLIGVKNDAPSYVTS